MPNGKPGDHALTDITVHRMTVFGPEIDDLVREIGRHPRARLVVRELSDLLWEHDPRWQNAKTDLAYVLNALQALRVRLDAADA